MFNPRLKDDIENGFLILPNGCNSTEILKIINLVINAKEDEYICADGSGNITTEKNEHNIFPLGLYGIKGSLKCAKIIAFFKSIQKEYTLSYDVVSYIKKIQKREKIYQWIQVGSGFYRDFEWRLVGNRDIITKTIQVAKSQHELKPLPRRSSKTVDLKLDLTKLWTCEKGEYYNIDNGEIVEEALYLDDYGWATNKERDEKEILQIRKYIHSQFVAKWSYKWIPGKSTKWCERFFERLASVKKGNYIDFNEPHDPVKYSASNALLFEFSKCGFAKQKNLDSWSIREIEYHFEKYMNNKEV